ncbi:hypothetical protein DRE_02664 [Drechslerella stenobrocha 248]|uniref:Uncharacterized protein n=1 Tax=Drechslerella stenobrocha 248 TaxID=1043628 RepID=W7IFZ1_9PEZI|nr:hypothetical protein DRE_02664 [Drechslerella stenobrocha 248]
MADWYEFDADFWDDYYAGDEDDNMATLANDLAESTVPDINWSIFDENPTSRDLQPFDWEDDWILFEFDHDEYYDTGRPSSASVRPKSFFSSPSQTPYPEAMDDEAVTVVPQEQQQLAPQQQQFHHDPVAVTAKDATAIAAAGPDNLAAADDDDDAPDGGLRKKRPDIQTHQSSSATPSGAQSRSQSNDRSVSTGSRTGSRSRRSRTPVPNPNTGPQPGEELEILYEDDQKKVVIVHTGGILGKLRVIRKDPITLQVPSSNGHGPSPLRNAANASDPSNPPETATLVIPK